MDNNRKAVVNFLTSPLHKKLTLANLFGIDPRGLAAHSDVAMFKLITNKARIEMRLDELREACLLLSP